MNALIASGRLSRIEDEELRLALAGLEDFVRDATEEEQIARLIGADHLAPLLRDAPLRRRAAYTLDRNASSDGSPVDRRSPVGATRPASWPALAVRGL